MEIGKYGVDPDYTEHAGAHDVDDGGDDAAPNSTGGGNAEIGRASCRERV